MVRLVKLARPFWFVRRSSFTPRLPPAGPELIATSTAIPASCTGFCWSSCNWIDGAGVMTPPLTTGLPGCVMIASLTGAPTSAVEVKVTGEPLSPSTEAVVV